VVVFRIAELALLSGPVVAGVAWLGAQRRSDSQVRAVAICSLLPSIFAIGAITGKTSFVGGGADAAFIALAYAGCCVAVGSALSRPRVSLAFAFGVASVALVVLGFLFGTVGVIGVGLIAADFEAVRSGRLGERHRFEVVSYGNVTSTDYGLSVYVYRTSSGLPFLERRVFSRRYPSAELSDLRVEVRDDSPGAVVLANGSPPTMVAFD
jgi:hypothetical protein